MRFRFNLHNHQEIVMKNKKKFTALVLLAVAAIVLIGYEPKDEEDEEA